jgi:nickel superoxide dismutase
VLESLPKEAAMKKTLVHILSSVSILLLITASAYAHCEIPCGIYDDAMRIKLIREQITTIEKSMNQILKLQDEENPNWNQLVRWVTNKEQHAGLLQEIVTQYFMTQRIKPGMENYDSMLAMLHEMLVYSMKCKQAVDTAHIEKLKNLVGDFEKLYFTKN